MKKPIFYICGILYRVTFQAIFNIFGNAFWLARIYLGSAEKRRNAFDNLRELRGHEKIVYINMLNLHGARYQYDGITKTGLLRKWPTWTALPIVTAYRGFAGNCQDFAVLARYCLGRDFKIKIIVPLLISKLAAKIHYIAYSEKDKLVISNTNLIHRTADEFARHWIAGDCEYISLS